MLCARGGALSDLPQHHRRRRARHARPDAAPRRSSTCTRCRPAPASSTGPIPKEWNIRAAHIKDPDGNTIVDFANSNLHVQGYSVPVARTMPLAELQQAPPHPARSARPHSLPHELLEGDLGLLPAAQPSLGAARRRLRGADRFHARRRCVDLRRVSARRRERGRVPAHRAHLPPLARQRQLLGAGAADDPRRAPSRACARGSATGSCSRPAPSGPSPGSPATRHTSAGSSTGSSSPASATAAAPPTRRAAGAIASSIAPWRTC